MDVKALIVSVAEKGISEVTRSLKGLRKEASSADIAVEELGKSGKSTSEAMRTFNIRVDKINGPLAKFGATLRVLPWAAVGAGAIAFASKIAAVAGEFQLLEARLTTIMGSEGAAQDALKWINDFAATAPVQVEEVTQTFIRLKNVGVDPMGGAMQALVDAGYAATGSFEGVERVSMALSQAFAKGKLQGEEMMQLMEANVPASKMLAEALGKTTAEIEEMGSKGQLQRKELELLIEVMGERYAGAAERAMNTIPGQLSNIQQSWTNMWREIAEGGAADAITHALKVINDAMTEALESGRIEDFGQVVGKVFSAVAIIIEAAFGAIPTTVELAVKTATQTLLDMMAGMQEKIDSLAKWGSIIALIVGDERQASAAMQTLAALQDMARGATEESVRLGGEIRELSEKQTDQIASLIQSWQNLTAPAEEAAEAIDGAADATGNLGEKAYATKMALGLADTELGKLTRDTNTAKTTFLGFEHQVAKVGGDVLALDTSYRTVGESLEAATALTAGYAEGLEFTSESASEAAKATQTLREKFASVELTADDLARALVAMGRDSETVVKTFGDLDIVSRGQVLTFQDLTAVAEKFGLSLTDPQGLLPALISLMAAGQDVSEIFAKNGKFAESMKWSEAFAAQFKAEVANLFDESFQTIMEGNIEGLGGLIEELFTTMAQTVGKQFGFTLAEAMFGEGTWADVRGMYEETFQGWQGAVTGAGMVYQGTQGGGLGGILSGILGGAGLGTSIAGMIPGLALAGPAGWIAAGIGAVVGGLTAWLGQPSGEAPGFRAYYSPEAGRYYADEREGFIFGREWGGLGFGVEQRQVWERNMNELVQGYESAYRSLVRIFGDPSLFNLLGEIDPEAFDFEGTPAEFAQWIEDVWLPDAMNDMFWKPIRRGLAGLGMDDETIAILRRELADMPGQERIAALEGLISTLVMAGELIDTSFADLQDRLDMSAMDFFFEGMDKANEQIELLQTGWEGMDLFERADDLKQIGAIFEKVTQDTLAMLQQIDAVREGVIGSFARIRESMELEGMSERETAMYAKRHIEELMAALAEATDPSTVQYLTSEIQRYMQMIRSSGVDMDVGTAGTTGLTWNEWLLQQIEGAEALALERLDAMEELVRQRYEETQDAFEAATNAVLRFADAVDPTTGVHVGGGEHSNGHGNGHSEVEYEQETIAIAKTQNENLVSIHRTLAAVLASPPNVTVENFLDGVPLRSFVQFLVDTRLREALGLGAGGPID